MNIIKLSCSACGAPISVKSDSEILFCSSCGTKFLVDRGEGYVALKLMEKVTQAVRESGDKAHAAIKENIYVTKVELKKVQISQSISTEEMKLNSLRQEIRELSRQTQPNLVMQTQLSSLRLEELNSLIRIRRLNMDMARLDEGWEDNLDIFKNDLAAMDEIVRVMMPFGKDQRIASRINELIQERANCLRELENTERRLILRDLGFHKYPQMDTLSIEQLENLIRDLQHDLSVIDRQPMTPLRSQIRSQVINLQQSVNAVYPRKKIETFTGVLHSLDINPPYPEMPEELLPLIQSVENDLARVNSIPESPVQTAVRNSLQKLSNELKNLHAMDIPSQKARKAAKKKRNIIIVSVIIGIPVILCVLFAAFVLIGNALHDASEESSGSSYILPVYTFSLQDNLEFGKPIPHEENLQIESSEPEIFIPKLNQQTSTASG